MIKLIIFDLDGTLVNTAADVTNALNYAIEPYPIEKMAVEKTIGMVGEGITRLIEKLLGEGRRAIMPDVLDRFLRYYSEHLLDFSLPYPGVRETLERLAGYKRGVISNKREGLSKRLLDELGLARHFDIILGSDSVEEKKPSPKPILQILSILSMKPQEALIVGDSPYDIKAGKAAGITTVAVTYGYRERKLLEEADFLIDKMDELLMTLDVINLSDAKTQLATPKKP